MEMTEQRKMKICIYIGFIVGSVANVSGLAAGVHMIQSGETRLAACLLLASLSGSLFLSSFATAIFASHLLLSVTQRKRFYHPV